MAGNFVNTESIGSLEFATKLAGTKLMVVLGHTECGAIKGAVDDAKLGNLTAMLANIRPSVLKVKGIEGPQDSKNKKLVQAVAGQNAKVAAMMLIDRSEVLRELVREGKLKVVPAMYDLDYRTRQLVLLTSTAGLRWRHSGEPPPGRRTWIACRPRAGRHARSTLDQNNSIKLYLSSGVSQASSSTWTSSSLRWINRTTRNKLHAHATAPSSATRAGLVQAEGLALECLQLRQRVGQPVQGAHALAELDRVAGGFLQRQGGARVHAFGGLRHQSAQLGGRRPINFAAIYQSKLEGHISFLAA